MKKFIKSQQKYWRLKAIQFLWWKWWMLKKSYDVDLNPFIINISILAHMLFFFHWKRKIASLLTLGLFCTSSRIQNKQTHTLVTNNAEYKNDWDLDRVITIRSILFQIVAILSCLFVVASTLSLIISTMPMFQVVSRSI